MLVQKISWLHVTCHINLHTMSILLADSWKISPNKLKQKRTPSVWKRPGMLKSAAERFTGTSDL